MFYKTMAGWLKKFSPSSVVLKAYDFANNAHRGVFRLNGEPYISHCLTVAKTVDNWNLDEESVAAAFLHDVVEDTHISIKDIEKEFGGDIAFLVSGLTKLRNLEYPTKDPNIENLRKLIIAMSRDLRVIIIKLADRLHNMKTLSVLPEDDRKKISLETIEIFAPLAYRLGMQKLSGELEDLAFPYLQPTEYEWLRETVGEEFSGRQKYAEKLKPIVLKKLLESGLKPIEVDSRAKRWFSLYKKLLRNDMNLEKIYDLVALRIIVKTVEECYTALGIIHKDWQPLQGRIKDYIARPKLNGYRSLHTTVFCVDNKITEIQIRTEEMHNGAELGIAAHWAYQQIKSLVEHHKKWKGVLQKKELLWVEQLRNWQKNFGNQKEFIDALKTEFFKDRIFVLTPQNDIIDLPLGATPVDFAYHIHSEIGHQCVGAKVNSDIVPLDYELQSGDLVEIIVQKGKKPSPDWLDFIRTTLAANYIKNALRAKNKNLRDKIAQTGIEFRIIAKDRPGYLKDIATAFAELKINIVSVTGQSDSKSAFSTEIIKCANLEKTKLEKLLFKLKKIPDTKEVNYKFTR